MNISAWFSTSSMPAKGLEAAVHQRVIDAERYVGLVRLVIVLGGIVLYWLQDQTGTLPSLAYGVLVIAFVYALGVCLFQPYRRLSVLPTLYFMTSMDAVLIALWVAATGGVNSVYYVTAYVAIASIAVRYRFREAIFAASLYAITYVLVALVLGQFTDHVPEILARVAVCFVVGGIAGLFARRGLDAIHASVLLRGMFRYLAQETEERRRAQSVLARYAEQLEQRIEEATAELRQAKEQVEAILNSTTDAVGLLRPDGTLQQVNPAFKHLFGLSVDSLYGGSLFALVEPEDRDRLTHAVANADQQPIRLEVAFVHGERRFEAEVSVAPLREPAIGDLSVVSLHDITARKEAEANLLRTLEREREINELKSRFASMVTHDFSTPLATIQATADVLGHYGDRISADMKARHIDSIKGQVERMTRMLDDMLIFSRAEHPDLTFMPEAVALDALCREIVGEFRTIARDHKIRFRVTGAPVPVLLDAKLMRHAITNLMSNAVKYSPAGSAVRLCLDYQDGSATIHVRDSGIGIPLVDQPKLFEPFHRARNVGETKGTGLGLAIVKQAVDLHGGTISVESRDGEGTHFTVALPLRTPEPDKSPTPLS
jgi:PAS domain S-box-containing protein